MAATAERVGKVAQIGGWGHTSYLSFLLHGQDFQKPNFTHKKQLKTPKTLKISLKKSNVCSFFHPIWKNLHLAENFYTGTACGAGDRYEEVCYQLV